MQTPNANLLIENGRLIDPSQGVDRIGRLLIRDGVFAAIDTSEDDLPGVCERFDATGMIVGPGLVDLGAELREPGRDEDETIQSGSDAALAGGYTSILCSSSTEPVIDSPAAVEFVRQKATRAAGVRIHVVACLSQSRKADQMSELGLLSDAGAVAFSDAPYPMPNDALLKRALEYCRMLQRPIFDRPEVPGLAERGVMHDGQVSLVLGLRGLPTEAEDLAVARDVRLAEATGGWLHVGPVSTMGAVDMLRRVKQRGVRVTASACPHSLSLTDEALSSYDSKFKVHPPLRSARHVETLVSAIADGTIDAIESGHMPRAREKKWNDLDLAPFGAATLETALSDCVTSLIEPGHLGWPELFSRLSTAPAKIAGVTGGTLHQGQPADVVVFDPGCSWTVDAAKFRSRCKSSPIDGQALAGRVVCTIVGGQIRFKFT
ncbi:MAG: dihydroorotase [Planctomycetota bacterium]